MIKPYVCSKSKDVDRNLRKVRSNYEEMLGDNKLLQDSSSYYLYEQILPNKTIYRGLLGLVSIEDFLEGRIKRHETALKNKKVVGAALDVFETEPKPEIQILMNPSLSLSPHVGGSTLEAQERIGTELAQQIIDLQKLI